MKNIFIISIIFLLGSILTTNAQRNANQTKFKKSARHIQFDNSEQIIQDMINQEYTSNGTNSWTNDGIISYTSQNEIIIGVKTLMNIRATKFLAVFNLTQVGETASKTDELINSRINAFLSDIKSLGLSEKNIYIDMIYLIPTFEYTVEKKLFSKTYNEVPTGFEMQKNIHISFSDINIVDDLVTLAAKNEIYDLVKVDFFVEDVEAINDTLINVSVDFINKKLTQLKKLNIKFDDKQKIMTDKMYVFYPESQYNDYDAFVSQSVEAIRKNTGVTSIRKPQTVAYNQVAYNNFNIVINPDILEPVVQFAYKLQIIYKIKEEKADNYMIITPNGDIKPLTLE